MDLVQNVKKPGSYLSLGRFRGDFRFRLRSEMKMLKTANQTARAGSLPPRYGFGSKCEEAGKLSKPWPVSRRFQVSAQIGDENVENGESNGACWLIAATIWIWFKM